MGNRTHGEIDHEVNGHETERKRKKSEHPSIRPPAKTKTFQPP